MTAQDCMTEGPACCTPGDTIGDAALWMIQNDCGALPVVESKDSMRLLGMLTDRDIACRGIAQGKGPDTTVKELFSPEPKSARPEDALEEILKIMTGAQVRRVPITDEEGRVVGIIAQADITLRPHEELPEPPGLVVEEISRPTERARRYH